MKRTPLHHLTEQARRVRDDAAGATASAHRAADRAQQTLDLLSGYLSEHLQRGLTNDAITPALLHVREHFSRKLGQAIDEQAQQRDGLRQAAAHRQQQLIECQRRLLAFETLIERRNAIRQRALQRADQRHTDEIAARLRHRQPQGPA